MLRTKHVHQRALVGVFETVWTVVFALSIAC